MFGTMPCLPVKLKVIHPTENQNAPFAAWLSVANYEICGLNLDRERAEPKSSASCAKEGESEDEEESQVGAKAGSKASSVWVA
eukprot:1179185-Rhodomonas_salina.2